MILDEPTSGLDALVRREFLESMVDRAAAGKTVFLSSHQIGEVERVADIVAIVRKGKLLALQRLDDLKGRIRELTVTLGDETDATMPAALAQLNGRLLSRRHRGHQWQAPGGRYARRFGDLPSRRGRRSRRRGSCAEPRRDLRGLHGTSREELGRVGRQRGDSMMGQIISYRIFWKEYRQMRGFWISLLAITVTAANDRGCPLEGVAGGPTTPSTHWPSAFQPFMPWAVEQPRSPWNMKNGTYDFLHSLPTKTLPTFLGKVAFTAVSAPLLGLAAYASAAAFGKLMGETVRFEWEALAIWGIGSLLLFVWATLFSLLMQHGVKAALFGGVAATFSTPLIAGFLHGSPRPSFKHGSRCDSRDPGNDHHDGGRLAGNAVVFAKRP